MCTCIPEGSGACFELQCLMACCHEGSLASVTAALLPSHSLLLCERRCGFKPGHQGLPSSHFLLCYELRKQLSDSVCADLSHRGPAMWTKWVSGTSPGCSALCSKRMTGMVRGCWSLWFCVWERMMCQRCLMWYLHTGGWRWGLWDSLNLFLKEKSLRGKRIPVFKWVEGSCGKGVIGFLRLVGIGLKVQWERFNLGTRENLLAAGIAKHREPSLHQQRFSWTVCGWLRWFWGREMNELSLSGLFPPFYL